MGVSDKFDEMKNKAKEKMGSGDEADQKIDAAGDKVDQATGNKMSGKVDKGQDMAKDGMDKLNE